MNLLIATLLLVICLAMVKEVWSNAHHKIQNTLNEALAGLKPHKKENIEMRSQQFNSVELSPFMHPEKIVCYT